MSSEEITNLLKDHPYLQDVADRVNAELVPLLKSSGITQDEFDDLALDYLDEINLDNLLGTAVAKDMAVKAFKMFIELAKMAA